MPSTRTRAAGSRTTAPASAGLVSCVAMAACAGRPSPRCARGHRRSGRIRHRDKSSAMATSPTHWPAVLGALVFAAGLGLTAVSGRTRPIG